MKRFFVLLAVVLGSVLVFSSCKKDENKLNYDEVLEGKWLIQSISPANEDTYLEEGTTIEFKSDHTFVLGSQWNAFFKSSLWATSMERATHDVYLLMMGQSIKDESVVLIEGRINLSGNDTVYLDCDDPFIPSIKYTYKLVRDKK